MSLKPSFAITGYFALILLVSTVGRLMGTGFGMTAFLNAAQAMGVFIFLFLCIISWLLQSPTRPILVRREILPHFLILCSMVFVGVLLGTAGNNTKIYLLSTTLYWLNALMFVLYVSTVDCSHTNIVKFGKWIAVIVSMVVVTIGGVDSALSNFLVCMFIIFAFGERRLGWAALCLLPFALRFSGLNRSTLLAIMVSMVIGTIIYRRLVLLSGIMGTLIVIVLTFATIDLTRVADPSSDLYRRLSEIQVLLNGTQRIDELVALQQRIFEIRLVNEEIRAGGPTARLLGAGFGKTLDMSSSQDEAVMGAATIGAQNVHNVHSLPHSIYLRNGYLGLAFLTMVVITCTVNIFRAMSVPRIPPLLAFCLLYPIATIVSALPAANYFLTEFILLALVTQASMLISQQIGGSGLMTSKQLVTQGGTRRRRIVWRL